MAGDGRPPVAVRATIGIVTFGGAVFAALLMLADRAPGLVKAVLGPSAERLWARVDARAPGLGEQARARPDFVVHVAVWAVITVLLALTIWTVWGVFAAAVLTFSASLALEVGQGVVTTSREVQASDVVANACGVALGSALALAVVVATWALARLVSPRRR